ncbi:2-hydroxyacid dehydrogenase [Falsirhodobacter algicola]|uniref:Glyoxylate/hydroxypyruvate reductase A n=1 Tax=Falsirhodobacter algicola TaxID=2692330 RepID=A0A8J8MUZ5_9RHOB|nr:glyoxylate/hydroxypyruvate reductase A [Falsirhodobacter algicola]QUS37201.1 glyoxylate/hydroxypyruvate reductase A [Falsirhodobacter algicola]
MIVAVHTPSEARTADWCAMLAERLPDWRVQPMNAVTDPAAVRYAVVWKPGTGRLAAFAGLKAIISIGAGIDHLLEDAALPDVPVIRTVGTDLTQRMNEYVALHVLRHHRGMPALRAAQAQRRWQPVVMPAAPDRRVGVMGLGNLGAAAAGLLAAIGFDVAGWSRSPRAVPGVRGFAGEAGLAPFLEGTEILVNLLPLTEETRGILDAGLMARLAPGAALINAARGPHLVEEDLLAALASGQIGGATLDVFHVEPLPPEHPFWTHPGVTVTPHVASLIDPPTGSRIIARNLRIFEETGTAPDIADLRRGY